MMGIGVFQGGLCETVVVFTAFRDALTPDAGATVDDLVREMVVKMPVNSFAWDTTGAAQ